MYINSDWEYSFSVTLHSCSDVQQSCLTSTMCDKVLIKLFILRRSDHSRPPWPRSRECPNYSEAGVRFGGIKPNAWIKIGQNGVSKNGVGTGNKSKLRIRELRGAHFAIVVRQLVNFLSLRRYECAAVTSGSETRSRPKKKDTWPWWPWVCGVTVARYDIACARTLLCAQAFLQIRKLYCNFHQTASRIM